jgi:ATP-dependent Clp protease ATP-binding subunit ClpC
MFERFTDRARQVIVLAQDEARVLGHGHLGTEHLLLGLVREREGVAAQVLAGFDMTEETVRAQVAAMVGPGEEATSGAVPFTPSATTALDRAWREALSLGHAYIDTHHVLLGLVRVKEGVAARILLDFDADPDRLRDEVTRMLSEPGRRGTAPTPVRSQASTDAAGVPSGALLWPQQEPAHLTVACPACATPIETITTDQPNTSFNVSAEGDRTCPGCGKRWRIAYTVSWEKRPGASTSRPTGG